MRVNNRIGLELLRTRTEISFNLSNLVQQLPLVTGMFFKYYRTGSIQEMYGDGQCVILPEIGECYIYFHNWFDNVLINGKKYEDTFSHLLSIDELEEELDNYKRRTEYWHEEGMIKIGQMNHWDIILLGVRENLEDGIYLFGQSVDDYHLFAKNIFDFFGMVTEYISDHDLVHFTDDKYNFKNVYKKLGEKEWRIR